MAVRTQQGHEALQEFKSPFLIDLSRNGNFKNAIIFLGIVIAYTLTGLLSLQLASINHSTSPFWPGSGVALAAILLFGFRFSAAVFVGAFVTNLTTGMSVLGVFSIAIGNSLEAVLSAALIILLMRKNKLVSYTEPLSLTLGCALGSMFGALVGATTLYFVGTIPLDSFFYTWVTWFAGDLVGALVFATFLMGLAKGFETGLSLRLSQHAEAFLYAAVTITISHLIFVKHLPEGIYWANCLVLLLANYRLNGLYSRLLVCLNCLLAIHYTLQGRTLFEFGNQNLNLLYLQAIVLCFSITGQFIEATIKQHLPRIAMSVFTVGLAVIIGAVSLLAYEERSVKDRELKMLVERTDANLKRAEEIYSLLLRGGAGFLRNNPGVNNLVWKDYVSDLGIAENYEAINGFGIVFNVNRNTDEDFLKWQRLTRPTFKIKTIDENYSNQFENLYPITYVEPYEKNAQAVGLDLGSESVRRAGLELSLKIGTIAATGPIQLVQDSVKRPGFLISYPIYDSHSQLIGWSYAPVIAEHFFSKALKLVANSLSIKIKSKENSVYYENEFSDKSVQHSSFLVNHEINLFGLPHQVLIHPKEAFFIHNTGFPLGVGIALTLFLVLLTSMISNISLFNARLASEVEQKSKELDIEKSKVIHSAKLASLGEMAAGIAHEVNNPLGIITGNIPLARKFKDNPEKLMSKLDAMSNAAGRIEKIVKGLKRFSRTSEGLHRENMDLEKIVQEALVITNAKASQNSVAVTCVMQQTCMVFCDPVEIEQVVVNLVNNGIDAVKNCPSKWIKIESTIENGLIVLRIIDSGSGISPEIESKLFQPFFTTKPVGEGTGLGLSITKGILDQHGASLSLNKNYKHTCFEIRFPLAGSLEQVKNAA